MKRSLVHTLLLASMTTGCFDPCDNTLLAEASSPDGKWKAVAFNRACGATTADSTHVSLLQNGASLPKVSGNLAVFEPGPEASAPGVSLRWRSASELEVAHDPKARWSQQERGREGVRISYVGAR